MHFFSLELISSVWPTSGGKPSGPMMVKVNLTGGGDKGTKSITESYRPTTLLLPTEALELSQPWNCHLEILEMGPRVIHPLTAWKSSLLACCCQGEINKWVSNRNQAPTAQVNCACQEKLWNYFLVKLRLNTRRRCFAYISFEFIPTWRALSNHKN